MSSLEHALGPEDSEQPLPTPRAFLTSLLKALSTSRSTTLNASEEFGIGATESTAQPSNPLSTIPTSKKSLLATLHVLFPPPTLLQALDLLDKGLVTRIHVCDTTDFISPRHGQEQDYQLWHDACGGEQQQLPGDIEMNKRDRPATTTENRYKNKSTFYTVRSAQYRHPYSRHGDNPPAAPGLVYIDSIHAWSCSCAAFAFAAFPPASPSLPSSSSPPSSPENDKENDMDVGGLSRNGDEHGGVPICKHLLACVLAERWEEVFGEYVKERKVSREEAGGICAG